MPTLALLVLWEAGKAIVRGADAKRAGSAGAGPTPPQTGALPERSIPAPRGAT